MSVKSRKDSTQQSNGTFALKAYYTLEDMILTLELKPGSVLSEKELIRKTGMGRTPLREALLRLEREGLVKVLPRKGIFVAEINFEDQFALLEVRRVLDRLIVEKAANRASPEEKERFEQLASELEKATAQSHLRDFMRLDNTFNELLWGTSQNLFAVRAVKPAHAHCRRFWFMYKHRGDFAKSAGLHVQLMKAIASGNANKAGNASDALIDYLEEFAKKAIGL